MARSKRKRKRSKRPRAAAAAAKPPSRSEQKDAAARAALEPLAEGERPTAVTVGALVAAGGCLANTIALIVGFNGGGQKPAALVVGVVLTAVIAVGMWRARYWAVLGLQMILALTVVGAALALVGANGIGLAAVALAVMALAGTLFWFLVKAMARIQMPARR